MRLIDADRLLDRCKFYHLPNGDLAVPIIDVLHAPTIEPELKWIPCMERLPEPKDEWQRRGFYLVTNAFGFVDIKSYEFYDDSDGVYEKGWQSDIQITAWQELPEGWKGETNEIHH